MMRLYGAAVMEKKLGQDREISNGALNTKTSKRGRNGKCVNS